MCLLYMLVKKLKYVDLEDFFVFLISINFLDDTCKKEKKGKFF